MSSTETLYLFFLATGFSVGFGHCIGMCGPIVVSLTLNRKGRSTLVPQLLYNFGRIVTYGILGGVMGATGTFTRVAADIAGIQKGVLIFTGGLIVVMGLAMTGWVSPGRIFSEASTLSGILSTGFRKMTARRSAASYFPLGLLLGLLPCGPVYTALIAAARAGMESVSPGEGILRGVGLMLAFGIGTVPALLIVSRLTDMRWVKSREMLYRIGGYAMVLVGVYFIVKGIRY